MKKNKLKIIVLLRETCDPRPPVRLTADGFGVSERGLRRISNPADLAALEQALRLVESVGGTVTAIAVGPERLDDHLRLALALGATRAIRVWSPQFSGGDVISAARLAARIIEILAPDLVLTGSGLLDRGDDPTLALAAAKLNLPCLHGVVELKLKVDGAEVRRKCDRGGRQRLATVLPCAVLFEGDSCDVRYPDQQALIQAASEPIEHWGNAELGLPATELGAVGALLGKGACSFPRSNPLRVVTPDANLPAFERILALLSGGIKPRGGKLYTLSVEDTVDVLMQILDSEGLLGEKV